MTPTLTTNGGSRKSLADQLDRLDRILDGLADALHAAVADAVQQAVRGVLSELLADPMIRTALAGTVPTATTPTLSPVRHVGAWLARCWSGVRAGLQALVRAGLGASHRLHDAGHTLLHAAGRPLLQVWQGVVLLRRCRGPVLVALTAGAVTGLAAYLLGPWLAAAAGGVGGFTTTLAVQTGLWLRRLSKGMGRSCAAAEPTGP
jgi:hypothetical protein